MSVHKIFDWLFPKKCLICGNEICSDSILCPKCFAKITFIAYPFCEICGKMLDNSYNTVADSKLLCETCEKYHRSFDKARALFLYDEISKYVIMKIKKHADNTVANTCCKMLVLRHMNIFAQADYIVPVPSHWSRILKRGYNPADIISIELSKISKIPVLKLLKRIRKTEYQKGKSIQERFENVDNAFVYAGKKNVSGKSIILVDDVMTTGATLHECSKALKTHSRGKIFCITIATTTAYRDCLSCQ